MKIDFNKPVGRNGVVYEPVGEPFLVRKYRLVGESDDKVVRENGDWVFDWTWATNPESRFANIKPNARPARPGDTVCFTEGKRLFIGLGVGGGVILQDVADPSYIYVAGSKLGYTHLDGSPVSRFDGVGK